MEQIYLKLHGIFSKISNYFYQKYINERMKKK